MLLKTGLITVIEYLCCAIFTVSVMVQVGGVLSDMISFSRWTSAVLSATL